MVVLSVLVAIAALCFGLAALCFGLAGWRFNAAWHDTREELTGERGVTEVLRLELAVKEERLAAQARLLRTAGAAIEACRPSAIPPSPKN